MMDENPYQAPQARTLEADREIRVPQSRRWRHLSFTPLLVVFAFHYHGQYFATGESLALSLMVFCVICALGDTATFFIPRLKPQIDLLTTVLSLTLCIAIVLQFIG